VRLSCPQKRLRTEGLCGGQSGKMGGNRTDLGGGGGGKGEKKRDAFAIKGEKKPLRNAGLVWGG